MDIRILGPVEVTGDDGPIQIRGRKEEALLALLVVNAGTTVSIDGRISSPFRAGDVLTIRRSQENFKLVKNPKYSRWHTLVTKLNWGRPPSYQ